MHEPTATLPDAFAFSIDINTGADSPAADDVLTRRSHVNSSKLNAMPATTDPPDNQGDGRTRSRLETEIEEILERAEKQHPSPPPVSLDEVREARQQRERKEQRADQLRAAGVSVQRWLTTAPILVSFMFAIVANMVSGFSSLLASIAVSAAVIAYFYPILEHFRNRSSSPTTSSRMWRGRDMGPPPQEQEPTPFDQLRNWFRNRRNMP